MPKTTYWLGTVSTNFDTAGNWNNGVPVTGDTVYMSSAAVRGLLTNIDRTADGGATVGLNLLYFERQVGCTQAIGSSTTNSFKLCADKFVDYGSADLYLYAAEGTLSTNDIDHLVISQTGTNTTIIQSGTSHAAGTSIIPRMDVLSGNVTIAQSNVTVMYVGYRNNPSSDAFVELTANGLSSVATVYQYGGVVLDKTANQNAIGNAYLGWGVLQGGNIATVFQTGGTFSGSATTHYAMNGFLDVIAYVQAQLAASVTITTQYLWPNFITLDDLVHPYLTVTTKHRIGVD